MRKTLEVGAKVTCAETGKEFTVETDGLTFNYACDDSGNIYSDEGVHIRNVRALLDRCKPFYAYLACDGKHVTGWKGDALGEVSNLSVSRAGWGGSEIARFRVKDVHGNWWQGRGAGKGMSCVLRPMKNPK